MYNEDLLNAVEQIFRLYSPIEIEGKDLYSYIASLVYGVPYEQCQKFNKDGTLNPDGKDLRNRVKQFLLPIVAEYGGITKECEE